MKKFEYLLLEDIGHKKVQSELNRLGLDGWELINFTVRYGFGDLITIIVKRELKS